MLVVFEKAGYPTGINPCRLRRLAEQFVSAKPTRLKGANELELILRLRPLPQRFHQTRPGRGRRLRHSVSGADSRGQPVCEGAPVAGLDRGGRLAICNGAARVEIHFPQVLPQGLELTLLPEQSAIMRDRFDDVAALATRTNKAAVLVVQQFPVVEDGGVRFPPVRESIANLMAFVELGTARDLASVLECAGLFNWIAVDCDYKLPESAAIGTRRHACAFQRSNCSSTATIRCGSILRSTWCSGSNAG